MCRADLKTTETTPDSESTLPNAEPVLNKASDREVSIPKPRTFFFFFILCSCYWKSSPNLCRPEHQRTAAPRQPQLGLTPRAADPASFVGGGCAPSTPKTLPAGPETTSHQLRILLLVGSEACSPPAPKPSPAGSETALCRLRSMLPVDSEVTLRRLATDSVDSLEGHSCSEVETA